MNKNKAVHSILHYVEQLGLFIIFYRNHWRCRARGYVYDRKNKSRFKGPPFNCSFILKLLR